MHTQEQLRNRYCARYRRKELKMMFNDLREFIDKVQELGECKIIKGADWDLEIGYIAELALHRPSRRMVLFDNIKGYPAGYRVLTNVLESPRRIALAYDLPPDVQDKMELVRACREQFRGGLKGVPPVEVETGPVKENIDIGDRVDLLKFPVPKWHKHDGGRYIGAAPMVIMRDPDEGWVNLGTYRIQVHGKSTATIHISPGRHGEVIVKKYWERGLSCPVAVVCGQDPVLFTASISDIPWGLSEYDYVGGLRNKPVEVVRGETVDLPIPAAAEIVLEGELVSPEVESRPEGPFGEWEGYYATGARPEPVLRVSAVLHRDGPILVGAPPVIAPFFMQHGQSYRRAASLWDELDRNMPGVKGAWFMEEAKGRIMAVISLKQQYPGHAKQAALLAAGSRSGAYHMNRFIIIVDDDIDPSNISEVLWALGTRCDPATSIDIISGRLGQGSDPIMPPEKKARYDYTVSTAMIYACKPYNWIKEFPRSVKSDPEDLEKVRQKWGKALFDE